MNIHNSLSTALMVFGFCGQLIGDTTYSFTTVAVPGAGLTLAYRINDAGQIAGAYSDASGRFHGFLFSNGVYTTIDFPGATATSAQGLNNQGQIVGTYSLAGGSFGDTHPFLLSGGVFTVLPEFPGSLPGTTNPFGINSSGQIVGYFEDACFCRSHGFLYSGGVYTAIDDPGLFSTNVYGINDLGQIIGIGQNVPGGGGNQPFILSGGVFTPITPVGSSPFGLNNLGQVAGGYVDPANPSIDQGFVFSNGTYSTINYLNVVGQTFLNDIDSAGQIVGFGVLTPNNGSSFFAQPACNGLQITTAAASPNTLWPPNHKMLPVTVSASTSGGCGTVSCQIISVASSEPVDPNGDWVITGNLSVSLRAARLGSGTGRIYTITVRCSDGSGHSTTKTVNVVVPHDQGS